MFAASKASCNLAVASRISAAVPVFTASRSACNAVATPGSFETGAVLLIKLLASVTAESRLFVAAVTASCKALIAASMSAVKAFGSSLAALFITSCKCRVAAATAGSSATAEAFASVIACLPASFAVLRDVFAASKASCNLAVASRMSLPVVVPFNASRKFCKASATPGSFETGAVLLIRLLASVVAASRSDLAAFTASCTAFVADSISAVKAAGSSFAAFSITSCKCFNASCTTGSFTTCELFASEMALSAASFAVVRAAFAASKASCNLASASRISLPVVAPFNASCKFCKASATPGSFETGAVLLIRLLASVVAASRSDLAAFTASCTAFVADSISAVKAAGSSFAAFSITSCKCFNASCTTGSFTTCELFASEMALSAASFAVVRAAFAASKASCNLASASRISLPVVAPFNASCKFCKASATFDSFETGVVFAINSLASCTASSRSDSATLTASCNAFVADSMSAVKASGSSLAALVITSCKCFSASCTAESPATFACLAWSIAVSAALLAVVRFWPSACSASCKPLVAASSSAVVGSFETSSSLRASNKSLSLSAAWLTADSFDNGAVCWSNVSAASTAVWRLVLAAVMAVFRSSVARWISTVKSFSLLAAASFMTSRKRSIAAWTLGSLATSSFCTPSIVVSAVPLASSRKLLAVVVAVISVFVASSISLAVDVGSLSKLWSLSCASFTADSFDTGAVCEIALSAASRAVAWLTFAVSLAAFKASIAAWISLVSAFGVSIAASSITFCNSANAFCTSGSLDVAPALVVSINWLPVVVALSRFSLSAANASCKVWVASSISFAVANVLANTDSNALRAWAVATSFETGAVLPIKSCAASRAACCLASAPDIASSNAFWAALISSVNASGESALAFLITSCKFLMAAWIAGSADWSDPNALVIAFCASVLAASRSSKVSSVAFSNCCVACLIASAVDAGLFNTSFNSFNAVWTAGSLVTGAVCCLASSAALRASSWVLAAAVTAVCNSAIFCWISAVKASAESFAASSWISCRARIASWTVCSAPWFEFCAFEIAVSAFWLAASRSDLAVFVASARACVALSISATVELGSFKTLFRLSNAFCTVASLVTAGVLSFASSARERASDWFCNAICSAFFKAWISSKIVCVSAADESLAASAWSSFNFCKAIITSGSPAWLEAWASLMAVLACVLASLRSALSSAVVLRSCCVASLISVTVAAGSFKTLFRFVIAADVAVSFETGAVSPNAVSAAWRASSCEVAAALTTSCNAFVASIISCVNASAESPAAWSIKSCNFCAAAWTSGSSAWFDAPAALIADTALLFAALRCVFASSTVSWSNLVAAVIWSAVAFGLSNTVCKFCTASLTSVSLETGAVWPSTVFASVLAVVCAVPAALTASCSSLVALAISWVSALASPLVALSSKSSSFFCASCTALSAAWLEVDASSSSCWAKSFASSRSSFASATAFS